MCAAIGPRLGGRDGPHDRCGAATVFGRDDTVSRVHALLVRVGNDTVLVDTSSTNGVYEAGASIDRVSRASGRTFHLGLANAAAVWRPIG